MGVMFTNLANYGAPPCGHFSTFFCHLWCPSSRFNPNPSQRQGDDNRIVPAHDFIASDNPVGVSSVVGFFHLFPCDKYPAWFLHTKSELEAMAQSK